MKKEIIMRLTKKELDTFICGDMEIQNKNGDYLYRGPTKTIIINNNIFKVKFGWLAKAENYPLSLGEWLNFDNLDYEISLKIYSIFKDEKGRLLFHSPMIGEIAVLFPKNGIKLDPSKVKGLKV
jgi:hypothetical protein